MKEHIMLPMAELCDAELDEIERQMHGGSTQISQVHEHYYPLGDRLIYNLRLARKQRDKLLAALKQIAEPSGVYSRDRLEHAENTIASMVSIARAAIAEAEGGAK